MQVKVSGVEGAGVRGGIVVCWGLNQFGKTDGAAAVFGGAGIAPGQALGEGVFMCLCAVTQRYTGFHLEAVQPFVTKVVE